MISLSFYTCFGSIRQEKKDPKQFGKIILIPMGEIMPSRSFYITPSLGWSKPFPTCQCKLQNIMTIYKSFLDSIPQSFQSSWRSRFQSWYGSPLYRSPFNSNPSSFQKSHSLLERTASERTINRPTNIILSQHRTLNATPSLGSTYLQTPARKP